MPHPCSSRSSTSATALGSTVVCGRCGGDVLVEEYTQRYSVLDAVVHDTHDQLTLISCLSFFLLQDEALSQRRELEALFFKDTADAYRVFDTIEHFLCQPEHLRGQLQVQLGEETQVRTLLTKQAVVELVGDPPLTVESSGLWSSSRKRTQSLALTDTLRGTSIFRMHGFSCAMGACYTPGAVEDTHFSKQAYIS